MIIMRYILKISYNSIYFQSRSPNFGPLQSSIDVALAWKIKSLLQWVPCLFQRSLFRQLHPPKHVKLWTFQTHVPHCHRTDSRKPPAKLRTEVGARILQDPGRTGFCDKKIFDLYSEPVFFSRIIIFFYNRYY